jgi:hypothetical protein
MTEPPEDDPIPDFDPIDITASDRDNVGFALSRRIIAATISVVALVVLLFTAEHIGGMSRFWQGIGTASHSRHASIAGNQAAIPLLGVSGASHEPGHFNTGDWQSVPLPSTLQTPQSIAATTDATAPGTLYFCDTSANVITATGPTSLWRSTDAGVTWATIAAPLPDGTFCTITTAQEDAQSLVVGVAKAKSSDRCGMEAYWLTRDGGLMWNALTMPPDIPYGTAVQCRLLVTQHHLYLAITATFAQAPYQRTRLERSDDRGLTWESADGDFGAKGYFDPIILGENMLAVNLASATQPAIEGLWVSQDSGVTWQWLGRVPGGADMLGLQPADITKGPPGYLVVALYTFTGAQIPSSSADVHITTNQNTKTWGTLPPLPAIGATAEHTGVAAPLALTGDGNLIALGADPLTYVPGTQPNPTYSRATQPPSQWLWIWNATQQHWYVANTPSPLPPSATCGFCWHAMLSRASAGGWDLWIVNHDSIGTNTLYHVYVPPLNAGTAVRSNRG